MKDNDKDEELIALLRANARTPVSELARRLGVSRTTAQARLEKLERNGTIEGYSLRLSERYRREQIRALVMIKSPPADRARIEEFLRTRSELRALYSISGVFDFAAVVSAKSVEDLDRSIDAIGNIEGVVDTMSSIILSTRIGR